MILMQVLEVNIGRTALDDDDDTDDDDDDDNDGTEDES